jgi:hypothetical protein
MDLLRALPSGLNPQRGQSMVEVALIVPALLLLMMILFDFGRVIWAQQVLDQDAREATRVGSLSVGNLTTDPMWVDRYSKVRQAAKASSVGVNIPDSAIKGAAGDCRPDPLVTTDLPNDTFSPGFCFYPEGFLSAAIDPGSIEVHITAQIPIITPLISNILGGSITLTGSSDTQIHS